jgi:hypothetical protein
MTKRKGPPPPLRMPDDTAPFVNAHDLLEALGVHYERPVPHQLKIGDINYFPSTGTIHVDRESKARSKRGKEALKSLLLERRAKLKRYVVKRNSDAAKRDLLEAAANNILEGVESRDAVKVRVE